jgi:cobalt-zinc-cadmium efflux system membrane fusion protein
MPITRESLASHTRRALVAAAVLCVPPGCDRPAAAPPATQASSEKEPAVVVHLTAAAVAEHGIRLEPVAKRALVESLRLPGRVALNDDRTARVASPVAGRVVEVGKGVGDAVDDGDPLVVVESPEFAAAQGDYLERRAALSGARSALDVATKAAERAQKLFANGQAIAESEAQKRQAELSAAAGASGAATAAVAAARAKLAALGLNGAAVAALETSGTIQARLALRSPIDGTVVDRSAVRGQLVGPDKDALFVVADLGAPWVLVDLPPGKAAEVRAGAAARVEAVGDGKLLAQGTVDRVGPLVDANLRSALARVVLAPAGKPGGHGDRDDRDEKPAPPPPPVAATVPAGRDDDDDKLPKHPAAATSPATAPATHPATAAGHEPEHDGPAVLKPGTFVTVAFDLAPDEDEKPKPVLAVPESAVQTIEDKPVVFVAGPQPNTFVKREVKLGELAGGYFPVTGGLKEGERVVVAGSFLLKADLGKEEGGD